MVTVFVSVVTEPILCEVVLLPGVVVGSWVDLIPVFLVFGTELVDGAPTMDVSRTELFVAILRTLFLLSGGVESIADVIVTEMGVAGLVPVVLVPRKEIT